MAPINKPIKTVGTLNKYFSIKSSNKNPKIPAGTIPTNTCIKFRRRGFERLSPEVEGSGLCWPICKISKKRHLNTQAAANTEPNCITTLNVNAD